MYINIKINIYKMSSPNVRIISIEGNIGSGKSTLLKHLKTEFESNVNVVFLREPVDEWEKIVDKSGQTMLQKFYGDQQSYSFPFQMMAYISRLKIMRDVIRERQLNSNNEKLYVITERSLYTDKHVFAKMLYDQGKMEDVCYQIYLRWFDEFAKDFPVTQSINIVADPSVCYQRIHKRSRAGEEVIPLDYLSECQKYHDVFLAPESEVDVEVLTLDGNIDIYENADTLQEWTNKITEFIQFM